MRTPRIAPWAAAGLLLGSAGGVAVTNGALSPAAAAVALAAAAIAGVVVWRVEYAPALIALTLPLDAAGRVYQGSVTITLFHLALLLSLVSWGVRVWHEPRRWLRFSALDAGVFALLAAVVWSLPHSLNPGGTAVSLVRLVFLALFTLLYANVVRDSAGVRRLLAAVGVTGVATSALVLFQYRFPEIAPGNMSVVAKVGGTKVTRVSGFFEDPNYLAGFLTVVIVASLAEAVHARGGRRASVWLGVFALSSAALVVTLSRTGWVAVLVGIAVVVLTAPRRRRVPLAVVTALVGALLVTSASETIVARFASITDVGTDRSVATRALMLESTVDIIERHWVWGTGLNAYERAYVQYRRPGSHASVLRPHQLPLAMWAEMGLAGLFAEVLLIGAALRQFVRRRTRGWTMPETLALAGVLTLLVQTLFQYYLYFEYLWLFLALCVIARRLAENEEASYA
ncbi:MAG: O-antigen ligase family protein [Coriobacteriia bacterium]|nr:O-antigen ligase family protein [Coriobacteriia bacterium]